MLTLPMMFTKSTCLLMIWFGTILPLLAQEDWKNVYNETAWADRDKWQKADELIAQLNLKPGSRVADIGCHEGYMAVKLSKVVGQNGRVYAVDVEQGKLDRLKVNCEKREISNVVAVLGNYNDPKLPENTLDAVIIIDSYHEMKSHDEILQHIMAALKVNGRLVLCEPIAKSRRDQMRDDQERKHELGMNFALQDLQKAGFTILKKQDPFVDRSEKGDEMWLLVAQKK